MLTITLKPLQHRNTECLGIYFTSNLQITKSIKTLKGVKWSHSNKCWYVLLTADNYTSICTAIGNIAQVNNTALREYLEKKKATSTALPAAKKITETKKPVSAYRLQNISKNNVQALAQFLQQLHLKSYSTSTIRTYQNEFCQLLQTIKNTDVNTLTPNHLKRYMVYAMQTEGISENTAHSRLNALKFYFEQVLGREKFFWEIPRPKKKQQLPKVISEEKILAGLLEVKNIKHRTILLLAYSAGLRVSEVISLKITDINSDRMQITINEAKGKKDRVVTLSPAILKLLREYYKIYEPQTWLFEGQYSGEHYSSRSAQQIFKEAYQNLGLPPQCSFHSLRHSYATHLLENGTDITYIQKLLGHSDIKTTLRYTQVSNRDISKIESPLDKIIRKKGG
jgi:site-specific recombinase XerD